MLTQSVKSLLWEDLAIFLLFAAMFGILLGLLLIFKPGVVDRLNRSANCWISTRHVNRWLERSISLERWFYHYHRTIGVVIVGGASYILIYFSMLFDKAETLRHLSGKLPTQALSSLLDALVLGSLVGGTVGLIAGLFLWLRPSMLRGIEEETNQWVSSRRATKVLDIPHDQMDRFIAQHAQQVGWILLLGSIYLFAAMFRWLI